MWDCSAEVWLNRLEAGVALEINRTSLTGAVPFTPNETGLYHITASAGALAWDGGYVPLTLSVDGAGSDPIVLFNWTEANNAPPYHTGRTTLRAGVEYTIHYDLRGFAAPADRPSFRRTAQLFVVPPIGLSTFSLQGALDDFVDYVSTTPAA